MSPWIRWLAPLAVCLTALFGQAHARRYKAPPKPKPTTSKTACWLFLTLDNASGKEAPASVDLCALGIPPAVVRQILATYGQQNGKLPGSGRPSGVNVLLEISMRLCSRWYAMNPGKLSHCANTKTAQLVAKARASMNRVPIPRILNLGGIPPLPHPAALLPPPSPPKYANLEKNELARAERFCAIAWPEQGPSREECLSRQVARMRDFIAADKSSIGEGDMVRIKRHCDRVAGDDREGYFGCLIVQIDRISRFQTVDVAGVDAYDASRADALCSLRHGDDRGNHYYCFTQEIRRLQAK